MMQYIAVFELGRNGDAYGKCTAINAQIAQVDSSGGTELAALLRLMAQSASGSTFWVAGNCTEMFGGWDQGGLVPPGAVRPRDCFDSLPVLCQRGKQLDGLGTGLLLYTVVCLLRWPCSEHGQS